VKKILLFSFILFIAFSCKKNSAAPNQVETPETLNAWIKVPVSSSTAEDIWFTNPSNGILATDNTGLFSSADGGNTWNPIPNTSGIAAFNLQFVDSLRGFVQGVYIWNTNDGGATWTKRSSTQDAIYSQFITPTAGFYFSASTGISVTHDGGITWNNIFKPIAPDPNNKYPFFFLDSLKGFSMMNGHFNTTSDGGNTWEIISNVTTKVFNGYFKMQFLDTLNGFCATPDGLPKTTDGGKNWINCFQQSSLNSSFLIPQFFDIQNGYFMTNDGIYKTTDGGQNWTTSCRIATGNSFSSIHFSNMNTGWATTYNGYILILKQ
jgi:photosystem II stability/assembly factor-like uncharacterized protein